MERFTISLDDRLAEQFDAWMGQRAYANRSEAIRDLLRAEIGKSQLGAAAGKHCVACLALHHEHHDLSVSTMHAHLDHDHCVETAILRGPTARVSRFADAVCAERGVHHGKLNIISVELHQPHAGRSAAPHVHLKPAS